MRHPNKLRSFLYLAVVVMVMPVIAVANTAIHETYTVDGQCYDRFRILTWADGKCLQTVFTSICGSSVVEVTYGEALPYECGTFGIPIPGELPMYYDPLADTYVVTWVGHGGLLVRDTETSGHYELNSSDFLIVPASALSFE